MTGAGGDRQGNGEREGRNKERIRALVVRVIVWHARYEREKDRPKVTLDIRSKSPGPSGLAANALTQPPLWMLWTNMTGNGGGGIEKGSLACLEVSQHVVCDPLGPLFCSPLLQSTKTENGEGGDFQ